MPQRANQTSFKPGVSGNPGGRPKRGESLVDAIRIAIKRKNADGKPYKVAIAERLLSMASGGDLDAIMVLLDRLDGKVPDIRKIGGADQPIRIQLTWDDDASDD